MTTIPHSIALVLLAEALAQLPDHQVELSAERRAEMVSAALEVQWRQSPRGSLQARLVGAPKATRWAKLARAMGLA